MQKLNAKLPPLILKNILLCALLIASHVSIADAEELGSKDVREQIAKQSPGDIQVVIAQGIQEKLSNFPLHKKKHVEAVIKNGALFMQLYLFGFACDTTSPYWNEDMGELVAMDSTDWEDEVCRKYAPQKVAGYGPVSNATRLVCSKVVMSDFLVEDEAVTLSFYTTSLGAVILGTEYEAFNLSGFGEGGLITVSVNSDDHIFKVWQTDKVSQEVFSRALNSMKWSVAYTDEYLKQPVPIIGKSIADIETRNRRYKTLISQIEHQADLACK